MDRTDQYPEVGGEESGLVPPQGYKGEWPKKIRTLTAVELDRLTIDGDGRFYWDGKLVNYVAPQHQGPEIRPVDLDALSILDRAAAELSGHKAEQQQTGTDVAAPVEHQHHVEQTYQPVALSSVASVTELTHAAPVAMPTLTPAYVRPDKVRITLSPLQSIGAILVVLGFLVGVAGVAASGFVAAHEWGCKAGMVKSYCPPPPPAPKEPARNDIPA
jgi:hypothetical protein